MKNTFIKGCLLPKRVKSRIVKVRKIVSRESAMSTVVLCYYRKNLGHKVRYCNYEMENQENSLRAEKTGIADTPVMVTRIRVVTSRRWKSQENLGMTERSVVVTITAMDNR